MLLDAVAEADRHLWVGNLRAYPSKLALERVFAKFGRMEAVKGAGELLLGLRWRRMHRRGCAAQRCRGWPLASRPQGAQCSRGSRAGC